MRELKFRAWDKEDKKYYPLINLWFDSPLGKLCTAELWLSPKATEIADIPEQIELEQYTGLKDKNGKEIYEGDIVLDYYDGDDTFIVEWDKDTASFILTDTGNISNVSFDNFYPDKDLEIIGNIYENPELLGEEK